MTNYGKLPATPTRYAMRRGRILPFFPGRSGLFFPALVVLGLSFAGQPVAAQTQAPGGQPVAVQTQAPATTPAPAASAAASPAPEAAKPVEAVKPADAAKPAAPAPAASEPPAAHPTTPLASSLIPHDLSPYGMFLNADIVVKVVMVGLLAASVLTWTILLAKMVELTWAKASVRRCLATLATATTLEEAVKKMGRDKGTATQLAQAALAEAQRSEGLPADGTKERAAALLSRIEARAGRAMGRGTGILATIGSTGPFIGLFGTVWGIMNSFIGISKTNTTNLAVVAPGIAEALLATACGLVAAIPAVIIYNMFARGITGYRAVLGDTATEVLRLLSRDLDREASDSVMLRRAAE